MRKTRTPCGGLTVSFSLTVSAAGVTIFIPQSATSALLHGFTERGIPRHVRLGSSEFATLVRKSYSNSFRLISTLVL